MQQHQPPVYTIGPENIVFIVTMLDDLLHIDEHPLCSDPTCPCHDDSNLVREYVTKPLDNGLLTNREAMRPFWSKQITDVQDDAAISNDQMSPEFNIYDVQGHFARGYTPDGSNYHDHLCRCPGCDYDGPKPTTDEEIEEVMRERSPLDVDIEENYHRPRRVSAHFQSMMDSLLIDHD